MQKCNYYTIYTVGDKRIRDTVAPLAELHCMCDRTIVIKWYYSYGCCTNFIQMSFTGTVDLS